MTLGHILSLNLSLDISEVAIESGHSLSYELGHVLATIHSFKLPQAGLFGNGMTVPHVFEVGSSPYFEEAFSIISKGKFVRQRLGDKLADKTISFTQENKEFFPTVEDNISLTHSDFKPLNLLYYEKKSVCHWLKGTPILEEHFLKIGFAQP